MSAPNATRGAIRLLGLDLDGTLFNDEKEITPRTSRAIRRALEAGCQVLPVTGRLRGGLPQDFISIPGVRWAVTANGAAILDLQSGAPLYVDCLPKAEALEAIDLCMPFDVLLDVYAGENAITQADRFARLEAFVPRALRPYFLASRTVVEDLRAYVENSAEGVVKLTMLFREESQRLQAKALLEADERFMVTSSLENNLEVNHRGVDKGRGLMWLAGKLGIPRAATMAVGDSFNDIAMLRAAGLGVAMGNAAAQAKAAADAVTADNNHDGVALAIERYILGEG